MAQPGRLSAAAAIMAMAMLAAVTTAPAQQVPPGSPRVPGSGQPSAVPGQPAPAPPGLPAPAITPVVSPLPEPLPTATAAAGPTAPAGPATSGSPLPGGAPSAAPAKSALLRFSGQLLDVRRGFVYFTTADAFRTSPTLRIVALDTGAPTNLTPVPRMYARATLDPTSGTVVELALTKRKIAADAAYQQAYAAAHAYALSGTPTTVAPELMHGQRLTGRPVAVTFYVQVPPTTPLSDVVYITTDASGWVANAMKMDRIDALHYRLTRTYASGTKFAYRYTRGSWTSVEVGEDGLQDDAHQFFVPEVDAKRLTDLVYRWSDENPTQPQVGPDSIPTPFNPNPFGNLPSKVQNPGIPPASPTPRP